MNESNLIIGKYHFAEYRPKLIEQNWTIYNRKAVHQKTADRTPVFWVDEREDAQKMVEMLDAESDLILEQQRGASVQK